MPTKSPKIHFIDDKTVKPDTGFRPTVDGKPHKTQDKPHKKYKDDTSKEEVNTVFSHDDTDKYNEYNYENVRPPPSHVGPGFFNPDTSKNQYPDFNSYAPNQRPPKQPVTQDQIPPELYHVFGQAPPQQGPFRIEHLLQQIQGADPNQGPIQHGQNPNVFLHPGQFGQVTPHQLPGGQGIAGQGSFIFLLILLLLCTHTWVNVAENQAPFGLILFVRFWVKYENLLLFPVISSIYPNG